MERLLCATDGSDHAKRAARFAGELSYRFGVPADLLNVVPEDMPALPGVYAQLEHVYITKRELLQAAGDRIVAEAASIIEEIGGDVGRQEVLVGSPAHEIVEFAARAGTDCIVMGRRGLGDMKGLLMGSVSHRVGHLTDLTLITVE